MIRIYRQQFNRFLFSFAAFMVSSLAADAAILSVPTQYSTIQAAVTAASPGDTVLVADGTFTGSGNKNIDFLGKDILLKSSGGAAACILDCQGSGRGFYLHSGESAAARIEGFTIKNGSVHLFTIHSGYAQGAGFYISSAAPIVANCIISNNSADQGGGMYGGTAINCIFTANKGDKFDQDLGTSGDGGGMAAGNAIHCTFNGNKAGLTAGGMSGGVATNCIFTGNVAGDGVSVGRGGGMNGGTAINCIFQGNAAIGGLAGGAGHAMYNGHTIHCTFTGHGVKNQSGWGTNVLESVTATNCILWKNTPVSISAGGGNTMTYCDVEGGHSGAGNINADPLFVDAAADNYHLLPASPCINTGTATGPPLPTTDKDSAPRLIDGAPDMGAYEARGSLTNDLVFSRAETRQVAFWNLRSLRLVDGGLSNVTYASEYTLRGMGDLDGDGRPDLIFQHADGHLVVWYMNGRRFLQGGPIGMQPPTGFTLCGVGDFNGDGQQDLIFQHQTTGVVLIWYMNGITVSSTATLSATPLPGYQVRAVGDFNGDGNLDVVLQHKDTGQVALWYLVGTTVVGGGQMSVKPDAGWQLCGATSLLGDARPNLMFQHATSGQVAYWSLNGLQFSGGALLTVTPNPGFTLNGLF